MTGFGRDLPVELTRFVGRERELSDIVGLLGAARLVTVTGPGGVGKTRIALRLAAQCGDQFRDGVCLVQLSALHDVELLANTVATALGLPETGPRPTLDAVADFLRDRKALLILDTCEHLIDACAMLADVLLHTAAGVMLLATSRQPLDAPGEHVYPVPPLAEADAVELFADCAASAVPGFTVTDANREAVASLCAQLDCVPLAIELAAVRLRAIPLEHLADRLTDRFRLLTGGRRSGFRHHQTLHAATEWSYELCNPAERLLWARLSVFAGSFGTTAVEDVCAGDPLADGEALATLAALVDKCVVMRLDDDQEGRYRLLDTIRDFGAEKLAASGEQDALRRRHLARYVALASHFDSDPAPGEHLPRLRQLQAEHAELRVALDYALSAPRMEMTAYSLATSLFGYWQISARLSEGDHWLRRVLDLFPESSAERARVLVRAAALQVTRGTAEQAPADLRTAIAMAEQVNDTQTSALGSLYLCLGLINLGRYEEATQARQSAEELVTAAGDVTALVYLDYVTAYLHLISGRSADGIARCDQGLARLGPDSTQPWIRGQLHLLGGLGRYLIGDLPASDENFLLALTLKRQVSDGMGIVYALVGTALVACATGHHVRAAWLLGAADAEGQRIGPRLAGDPFVEALYQQTMQAARDDLGADRFETVYRRGADSPLDEVVRAALAGHDELRAGASSAVSPEPDPLTGREREIAALTATGMSNQEIADKLKISKRTVGAHLEHIYEKLGISSRVQLANWVRSS